MRYNLLDFNRKGRQFIAALLFGYALINWRGFAKMLLFHCHATAAAAHKLHFRQLVLANMGVIRLGSTAETAFGFVAARIAQMTGLAGHRATTFTCIRHY
jgi:hypothetical protein